MIGDRSGDRLPTTYHRSKSTMNKGLVEHGDRLKEDFHFVDRREWSDNTELSA